MQYLDIPGVPVPQSRLVLGTMTFGDTVDLALATRMVDTCLDAGITSLDTANGYAGTKCETMLGEIIAGRRDKIVLATKAGIYPGDAAGAPLLSAGALRASLDASLQRLGVDDVDIFYLHQPDRSVPLAETIGTLKEFIDAGKIRSYGVSNYAAWQIAEIIAVAEQVGAPPPVLAQQLYNMIARRLEDEYLEFSMKSRLGTIVYNPLGGGLLTGKHTFDEAPGEGRFGSSGLAQMYRSRYWNEGTFDAVGKLSTIAAETGISMPALAFRWLLSKPVTTAVLLGGSKVEQLQANIAAAEAGPLPEDVIEMCDEVGAALKGPMPAYNR